MGFAIYSLKNKSLILCGIPIKNNFVSCEIEPPEAFTVVKSGDGSMTRCETGDTEYKIKLTLKASSSHTSELAALHALDTSQSGGSGVGPFEYTDGSGSTAMVAPFCWISKPPTRKIGAEVQDETWEFTASSDQTKMLLGGNTQL
jgi:hypothetical protein